jgi:Amidases related to nicotinamidase
MNNTDIANQMRSGHTCIVTIDLHRGHLDPEIGTLPLPEEKARRVIENCIYILNEARKRRIPIIHVVTVYRNIEEILSNPFWSSLQKSDVQNKRKNMINHNLIGSPQTQLMPGIYKEGDFLINNKKRYDAFYSTDLEFILRSLECRRIAIIGVNTNSCVLATAASACSRDFEVIVISDGVDTMDEPSLHQSSLRIIETAFGRVLTKEEFFKLIDKESS